eukprot:scaffold4730_cov109-Isochrysis_galbana.AAC.7
MWAIHAVPFGPLVPVCVEPVAFPAAVNVAAALVVVQLQVGARLVLVGPRPTAGAHPLVARQSAKFFELLRVFPVLAQDSPVVRAAAWPLEFAPRLREPTLLPDSPGLRR